MEYLVYISSVPIAVWFLTGVRLFMLNFDSFFENKDYLRMFKCATGLASVFMSVYTYRLILDYVKINS